ncbi:MAG: hypothetical protein ABFD18_07505 [Syntrophomonas sp.]
MLESTTVAENICGIPEQAGQLILLGIPSNVQRFIFNFNLLNNNSQLNLIPFKTEIEKALQKILSGGKTGRSYANVIRINLVIITNHFFELDVELAYEDDTWVKNLPKYFVNLNPEHIRPCCLESDSSRLFKVTRKKV